MRAVTLKVASTGPMPMAEVMSSLLASWSCRVTVAVEVRNLPLFLEEEETIRSLSSQTSTEEVNFSPTAGWPGVRRVRRVNAK